MAVPARRPPACLPACNGEATARDPSPIRHVPAPLPRELAAAAFARVGAPGGGRGAPPRRRGGAALRRAVPRRG